MCISTCEKDFHTNRILRSATGLLIVVMLFYTTGYAQQVPDLLQIPKSVPSHTDSIKQPSEPADKRQTFGYGMDGNMTLLYLDTVADPKAYTLQAQKDLQYGHYFTAIQKALYIIDVGMDDPDKRVYLSPAYNIIGTAYSRLGNILLATRNYLNAVSYKEQLPESPITLSDIYNNLGTVMPDNIQAFQYFDKAYHAAQKENNVRIMGMALQNKSLIHEKSGDYEKADQCIRESYTLGVKHQDSLLIYVAFMRWANSAINRGEAQQALDYIHNADMIIKHIKPHVYDKILHQTMKGEIYLSVKDYNLAEKYFLHAEALANTHHNATQEIVVSKALAKLYEQKQDYPLSQKYLKRYVHLKDSVLNENISQGIGSLELQYRVHEKDKALAAKEQEILKRNYLLLAIASGLIFLGGGFYFYYRHTKQKQKVLQQEKEISHLKATMNGEEQERIRIARELHDGIMVQFSSVRMNLDTILESPESEGVRQELGTAIAHLDDATRELRRSAHNLMPDMLLAEGLSGAIQYFCTSISQRSGVSITFQQYGTLPVIQTSFELMLYRIVQELVQNAMKYAQASNVLVQLDITDTLLTITVEDNGIGIEEHISGGYKEGSGLRGIRDRIVSLKGHMDISSENNRGATIYIELELTTLQTETDTRHAYIHSNS